MNQAMDISWPVPGGVAELVPPPVRGRGTEHGRITQWVRRLIHRRAGGVLWIDGPADVGKSRLVACAGDEAALAGARLLVGAGLAGGELTPLAPLLDALTQGVDDSAHDLRGHSLLQGDPYWLVREIGDRLRALARDRPVALLLDDLQVCDELTLHTVRALTVRLADLPILWVLAARSHGDRPAVEALRRDLLAGPATHLGLQPLTEDAVREMARDLLGPRAPEAVPYLRYLDGLPGAVRHLCARLASEPSATAVAPATAAALEREQSVIAPLVARRLRQLSDEARQLTQCAAVLGERLSARHLARVLDCSETALLRPLREVLAARLLRAEEDQLRFRHALVRRAVSAGLPRPVRQSVRRRSVDLHLKAGVPATAVAAELVDVAEPGDMAAIDVLRAAARALAAVSPRTATDHLRRAMSLAQGVPEEQRRIAAELTPLLWQVGEVGRARELADGILQSPPDATTHARTCLHLLRMAGQFRLPRPDAHLDRAQRRHDVPKPLKDELLSLTLLNDALAGDVEEVDGLASDALERIHGTGAVGALTLRTVRSLTACHRQDWDAALRHGDAAATSIARLDPVHAYALPEVALSVSWHASVLGLAGRDRTALELVDDGLHAAQASGRRALLPLWRAARARLLLDAGRLTDAASELSAAEAVTADVPARGEASALCTRVRVACHTGDDAALETCAARADACLASDDPRERHVGAWLTVVIAAHRDERPEPRHLAAAATYLRHGSVHAACVDPGDAVVLVRVALRRGRRDIAAETVEFAEDRARRNPGFALFQAVAAHTRGLLDGDRDRLLTATERYGDARPLLAAEALADTGELTTTASAARTCFERALELYDGCGARQESARVRNRLRGLGIRSATGTPRAAETGWRGLTPAELGVVRLIAHGATNRAAAERLFLSPHTVNTHLRHAFHKLGVRSRVQLARLYLREVDQTGTTS
ncbi:helix-turn-helix transcriptional regulator [Streptomyces flavalbus]|uniref:LuxR C-terminal-related transcriptional regulator n=1 Tax=Streptomyces flavalbus TaxID=2665155 RepID=A0ABW2WHW6_9ACTN